MRITLLTPGTGHFYCGSCLRDSTLAKGLRARGHEVVMTPLYLPFVLENEREDGGERVHMGGINLYLQQKLPLMRFTPSWIAELFDRPGLLRWASSKSDMTASSKLGDMTVSMLMGEQGRQSHELERLVGWLAKQARPDVVCLSNVMLVGLARRLKQELEVPVVCSLQGEAPFLDGLPQPYRDDAWATLSERSGEVDAFIPVSHYYARLMRERLALSEERVHVVHNGIEADGFAAASDGPATPTIGFLARMCADKGLHTLVEAFLILKGSGRVDGLRLRAAGALLDADRGLVEEQRSRVERAGFARDADFLPNVTRGEKLEFLRSISVLSVPATYGESFGLYVLEALASGVPVVQPRHAAFPEILEATGGGVLCEPDDPEALAEGLAGLLLDERGAREMGDRGREIVRSHFNSDRMAREVEGICKTVTAP